MNVLRVFLKGIAFGVVVGHVLLISIFIGNLVTHIFPGIGETGAGIATFTCAAVLTLGFTALVFEIGDELYRRR